MVESDMTRIYNKLKETLSFINTFKDDVTAGLELIEGHGKKAYDELTKITTSVTDQATELKKYLPKLDDISTSVEKSKEFLDTVRTDIGTVSTTLGEAKKELVNIAGYTEELPDMASGISGMKTQLTSMGTYLSDIKTKITDNLPKLSKLDTLDTIKEKLETLDTTIKNLDFGDLSLEGLDVSLDDSKIVGEIQKLTSKFDTLSYKLDTLDSINENLINTITLQQYGIGLLRENLPMAQSFFDFSNTLFKVNDLGFKLLSAKIDPVEYFEKFQELISKTQSVIEIPEMPVIEFSRPEPLPELISGYIAEPDPSKVPGPPKNLQGKPSGNANKLIWEAPDSVGGSPITGYRIYRETRLSGTYDYIYTTTGLEWSDSDVTGPAAYRYYVTCTNFHGESEKSNIVTCNRLNGDWWR